VHSRTKTPHWSDSGTQRNHLPSHQKREGTPRHRMGSDVIAVKARGRTPQTAQAINAIADSREGERTSVLRPPSLLILNLNRYRTSIRYRERKPKRNREETPTGCMGEICHRSLNEGETHTNRMSDKRYRGSRRERGIVRDTWRLTSVSHPTPPPLLLILIIVVAAVPQASVSRHDLELSTVQCRRRGDT
jgi:hypothetical protein